MVRAVGLALISMLLLASGNPAGGRFSKYRSVEAYEIRTGILATPRYSSDGHVCEIVVERHHFENGVADLHTTISHDELLSVIDELVPASERGSVIETLGREYVSMTTGRGITTSAEYANVSINIFNRTDSGDSAGGIVAQILWKDQHCH
jgi:hypothetical protein